MSEAERFISYRQVVDQVTEVGVPITIPEIVEKIESHYPDQMHSTLIAKVHRYLTIMIKYQCWEKVGTRGRIVVWRRRK